jgi:hypothetical protein
VSTSPLRPASAPYSRACSTGYQPALATAIAATSASFAQAAGASRKPTKSTPVTNALARR